MNEILLNNNLPYVVLLVCVIGFSIAVFATIYNLEKDHKKKPKSKKV